MQFFLARLLQDFPILARKALFLMQDLQDLVQDLASLEEKFLQGLHFLQDDFYWVAS